MFRSTRLFSTLVLLACIPLAACNDSGSSTAETSSTSAQAATVASTSDSAYSISGVVAGSTGAKVSLIGSTQSTTTTDSNGNFSFAIGAGNYTVSPSQTGYVFSPVSRAETVSSSSLSNVTFAATASTAPTYTVSGTVTGSVSAGVVITLNGTNGGSAVTDLSGNYTFTGLVSGTYTVNASLSGYSFTSPVIVSLSNVDSAANNFTSTTATAASPLAFTAVAALPQATVGSPYSSSTVKAITGGTAPYHYQSDTLDAGSPPLGMIVNPNGDLTGTASVPGQYPFSVCATDSAGNTSSCEATSITVVAAATVAPAPTPTPAPTVSLAATPAAITSGSKSTLTWSGTNATSCTASGGWAGTEATSGTASIAPTSTTTYTLACSGSGGTGQVSTTITVGAASPAPVTPTVTLTASAATIPSGSSSMLKWAVKNSTSCTKSGGWSGTESAASGAVSVSPASTTTYSLACTNSGLSAQTSTKVTVDASAPAPAPTVTLTANPTSITSGSSATLTWSSANSTSCDASGGWTGTNGTSGTQSESPTATTTYTLACTGAGGTTQTSAKVTVTAAASPTPPTTSGTSWIYYNGAFDWPGDWPFSANTDYTDTSGGPLSGSSDLKITLTGAFGGWIPWAQNFDFNSVGYTKLTFALKPTIANQTWSIAFVKVGDVPVGITLNVANYGPAPVAGQWGTYTIPLSDLGVLGTSIYKFVLQDQTGQSNNTWYVDNVGFVP
jgi:hypothetical protein